MGTLLIFGLVLLFIFAGGFAVGWKECEKSLKKEVLVEQLKSNPDRFVNDLSKR